MSMIEKEAKAIYDSHRFVKDWDHPDTQMKWHASMRAEARAAIKAMREPTGTMKMAGAKEKNAHKAPGIVSRFKSGVGDVYSAMIDAALEEDA